MADTDSTIVIDGKPYTLDPDDLELWEVELLEDTLDAPLAQIDFNRAKALRVLAYVVLHRDNPSFTLEDAKHIKLSAIGSPEEGAKAKRPTKAAAG